MRVTRRRPILISTGLLSVLAHEDAGGPQFPVARPEFRPATMILAHDTVVSIAAATPGIIIRYTKDSTTPGETSAQYTGPLRMSPTTIVRARAWAEAQYRCYATKQCRSR